MLNVTRKKNYWSASHKALDVQVLDAFVQAGRPITKMSGWTEWNWCGRSVIYEWQAASRKPQLLQPATCNLQPATCNLPITTKASACAAVALPVDASVERAHIPIPVSVL